MTSRYSLVSVCLLLLAALCAASVHAQDEPPPPPPQTAQHKGEEVETIRVNTELVDLNVSVFSRDLQLPVGDLQQKDFAVLENGSAEEISFFASSSTPFDLVLLIDLSGSTANKLDLIRKSAIRFVESARSTDRIGIVTFTNVPHIVSSLSTDRKLLVDRIKEIGKPRGGTNFWDALHFVLKDMLASKEGLRRQAVVVMSDGVDNALPDVAGPGSETTYELLLEAVKTSEAIVVPIYLDTESEMIKQKRASENSYRIARQQFQELAGESGSHIYHARNVEDLNGVYERVVRDLGRVYIIGYQPKNRIRDGSWRSVSVQVVNRPDLTARSKRGYYAR